MASLCVVQGGDVEEALAGTAAGASPTPMPIAFPGDTCSYSARITLSWVYPLMKAGFSRPLVQDDVWDVPNNLESMHVFTTVKETWAARRSLLWSVMQLKQRDININIACHVLNAACQVVRPVLLGLIIKIIEAESSHDAANALLGVADHQAHRGVSVEGVLYCVGMGVASVVSGYALTLGFKTGRADIGCSAMVSMSVLVFDKALRISGTGGGAESGGKESSGEGAAPRANEANLIASDAQNLVEGAAWTLRAVEFAIVITAAVVLLFTEIGTVPALCGIAVLVLAIALQSKLGGMQHLHLARQQKLTDARVRLMSQALTGIRTLKFNGWERQYSNMVSAVRVEEMVHYRNFKLIFAINEFFTGATSLMVALAAFSALALLGGELTASAIFVSLALFNLLRQPLTFIPMIVRYM
jgi:ABC-type multidrug transport system fused ATPase/permease subunit